MQAAGCDKINVRVSVSNDSDAMFNLSTFYYFVFLSPRFYSSSHTIVGYTKFLSLFVLIPFIS